MKNWERQFEVGPEGEAKEVELSEEERLKRFKAQHPGEKKIIRLEAKKRKFIVNEKGETEIVE